MTSQTEIDIIKGRACDNCGRPWGDCLCDMNLPDGRVCGDCLHWKRCKGMISSLKYEGKRCDFSPSRFVARP
jgi:hypothetical protein